MPLSQIFRLFRIVQVLTRHGLDDVVLAMRGVRHLRWLVYLLPWRWGKTHRAPIAVRIRLALEELGPIFVKFGQVLSTRRDLLPNDIANELAKLQDRVPAFPDEEAKAIIEETLGDSVEKIFQSFDEEPIASASIAQVHGATLPGGSPVVVKVLRPNIDKMIKRDVKLLRTIAGLIEKTSAEGRRLRPKEVVAEFEKIILDELDFQREAANLSQLRRNFLKSELLYVPEVHWPWVRKNVLVMERIKGIPVSDMAALKANEVDLQVLAERGVEIFFTQVFKHCFFHADMHPGNIFIDVSDPKAPRYIAIDCGIMGTLMPEDQRYLAENFLAFFRRDYRRVAELHIESGWVPAGTRVDEFESAIRTVCEPIFEKPLKDISFGHFLLHLFNTARRFHMEVQPQLVLLQKTLLSIEGLGRQLYPDLDLWKTAKPILETWMEERTSPMALLHKMTDSAPQWIDKLPRLPELILQALEQRQLPNRQQYPAIELNALKKDIEKASYRMTSAILIVGVLISAALLVRF